MFTKAVARITLTILMYAGVVLFITPYLAGRMFSAVILVVTGAAVAIVAGLARCFLTEGDCTERDHLKQRAP